MRILLVDDETLARARLKRLLSTMPMHVVVGEAAAAADLPQQVESLRPDVVLLDIQMPGGDGLNAAQALAALKTPPAVIFVTAYPDHALAAFETLASGYLLKPVSAEALAAALERAQRQTRAQMTSAPRSEPQFITAIIHGERHRIGLATVCAFLAEDKYTRVIHLGGECLIEESLRSLEERLPDFLRVHRQCLVARVRVRALERDAQLRVEGYVHPIPVSRRCLGEVRKLLASPT